MLALRHETIYSIKYSMKQLYVILVIMLTVLAVINFENIVIFFLSGSIPGVHFSVSPSMSIATMIASALTVGLFLKRTAIYTLCLKSYDHLFGTTDAQVTASPAQRPRRRYQEL